MNANQATVERYLSPEELKKLKPHRRDFLRTFVVANNASIIEDSVWKPHVGDLKGSELKKALKKLNLQMITVFDQERFDAAKASYLSIKHETQHENVEMLIETAFTQAGQPRVARIESTLRSLLPVLKNQPTSKKISTFKSIIRALSPVMSDLREREERLKKISQDVQEVSTSEVQDQRLAA